MGLLDNLTQKSRVQNERATQVSVQIQRAAYLQAQVCGIRSPEEEINRLNNLYNISNKSRDWRDWGDIAFHFAASYPPDLAYLLIYALRQLQPVLGYDPVPYVFLAVQNLHRFRPDRALLRVERMAELEPFFSDSPTRSRAAAKLITRELSVTPLRHASGILACLDESIRLLALKELQHFDPEGATMLSRGNRMYLTTGAGLLRFALRGMSRLLFGKED